jgi:hypothetical protein
VLQRRFWPAPKAPTCSSALRREREPSLRRHRFGVIASVSSLRCHR